MIHNGILHRGSQDPQTKLVATRYASFMVRSTMKQLLGTMVHSETDTRPGFSFNEEVVSRFERLCQNLGIKFYFATRPISEDKDINDIKPIELFSLIFGIEIRKYNSCEVRAGQNPTIIPYNANANPNKDLIPDGAEPFYIDNFLLGYIAYPDSSDSLGKLIAREMRRVLISEISQLSQVYFGRTTINFRINRLIENLAQAKEKEKEHLSQIEALLKELLIDDLTGLLNRRGLLRAIDQIQPKKREIQPIERLQHIGSFEALKKKSHFLVIVLDGDRFKAVNDNGSHDIGNKVLGGLAQAIPGGIDLVARTGGEEFIIVHSLDSIDQADGKVNEILNAIRSKEITLTPEEYAIMDKYRNDYPTLLRDFYAKMMRIFDEHRGVDDIIVPMRALAEIARDIPVLASGLSDNSNDPYIKMKASMGYVVCSSPAELLSAIAQADLALKVAKNSGRNRAIEYDPSMETDQGIRPRDDRPPTI